MDKPKVAIIFPAYNEEQSIGSVIREVPVEELKRQGYCVEIIVVDNNSTDRTRLIAEQHKTTVLTESRQGKGNAINTAFKYVNADYIFMLDADNTYPPRYIPDMVKLLHKTQVVIGSRIKGSRERGALTQFTLVGNIIISLAATLIFQKRISDVCSGYWGFRGYVVKELKINVSRFELEAKIFCTVAKRGFSISELPIHYRRRAGGSTKLNPLGDGIKIILTLLRERFA